MSGGGFEGTPRKDLHMIAGPFTALLVLANHHQMRKQRVYRIGLRGDQCVVIASDVHHQDGRTPTNGEWQEIAFYERNASECMGIVCGELDSWVHDNMHQLAADALSGYE